MAGTILPRGIFGIALAAAPQANCFVSSDTGETGCGAHMTLNQGYVCHTMWTENECTKSSARRELYAIDLEFALKSFCDELKDCHVKWSTDNLAAAKR